jgi:predicted nucleic acid-binding protein
MIVLDAAALVDVVIGQPIRPWVLDRLRDEALVAPAHQPAEVVSAIARLVRAGDLDEQAARGALRDAAGLAQELLPPSPGHLVRALEMQDRVRVLDALYVVLAQDLDAAILTTDRRLGRADLPVPVLTPPDDD